MIDSNAKLRSIQMPFCRDVVCAHYLYEGNIKTNHRRADFIFTFAMRYCKQTSDEDQMLEGVKMSPFLEKAAKRVRILAGINVKI